MTHEREHPVVRHAAHRRMRMRRASSCSHQFARARRGFRFRCHDLITVLEQFCEGRLSATFSVPAIGCAGTNRKRRAELASRAAMTSRLVTGIADRCAPQDAAQSA